MPDLISLFCGDRRFLDKLHENFKDGFLVPELTLKPAEMLG